MKAVIIGATGATGMDLLKIKVQDAFYSEVVIFVQRSSGVVHSKLKEIITDFDKLEEVAEFINGDVLFSCLGNHTQSGWLLRDAGIIAASQKVEHYEIARPSRTKFLRCNKTSIDDLWKGCLIIRQPFINYSFSSK